MLQNQEGKYKQQLFHTISFLGTAQSSSPNRLNLNMNYKHKRYCKTPYTQQRQNGGSVPYEDAQEKFVTI
jgi:hypothetical protein